MTGGSGARWRVPAALAAALLLAGCGSGGSTPTAASTAPTPVSTIPARPGAYTVLTLAPLSAPTFPVPGTDGKYHVAYDIQLTNASAVPATLTELDVVDAAHPAKVVASFAGAALVAPGCAYGDCNRLRMLPSAPAPSAVIPPQESRAVLLDFTVDAPDRLPRTVLHRVRAQGAASPSARTATPLDYLAMPFDIAAGAPRSIAPPVRGDHWIALNGCCEPGFPHRPSLLPTDGRLGNSQRFAIDWMRTDDQGAFYTGDRHRNESYADYGADVYAVADGTITGTLDGMAANAPGVLPADDPVPAAKLTVANVDGNHIVEDLGGGVYAMYAHFLAGSLLVKPGQQVKRGQQIARLGNTGNANAPHLHLQLMNGPDLLDADGVPYVIDTFDYAGQVAPDRLLRTDDYLTGTFLQDQLATPQTRRDQLPLNLAIVDFPRH